MILRELVISFLLRVHCTPLRKLFSLPAASLSGSSSMVRVRPLRVRGTTQDVIAGDPVEIGGAHQKIKTAFPDAVFIMGKQSLGDPKLLCGTLLADALFFS